VNDWLGKGISLLAHPWCQEEPTREGQVCSDACHQELDKSDNIEGGLANRSFARSKLDKHQKEENI
jgi:hypothetical protein